jgi:hypothetical protein
VFGSERFLFCSTKLVHRKSTALNLVVHGAFDSFALFSGVVHDWVVWA